MVTEVIPSTRGFSVRERRQRNHEEMRTGILAVARDIMREQGVAALNLNETARRLGITPPALYTYFPSKMALYDALYQIGIRLFREAEEELWRTTAPNWERIHAWFTLRLVLAEKHPDLYHLVFDVPIPGFELSPESLEEVRQLYEAAVGGFTEVIEAGVMQPKLSPEEATHLLITMRLGLVAAHVGKHRLVSPPDRFARLVDEIVAVLRAAWEPKGNWSQQDAADEKGGGTSELGRKA
jgi:AcrR family transcriptional regulator